MQEKLLKIFLIFFSIIVIGIFIFHVIEKNSILDSIYATVITIATVGYGDIAPKTSTGKILTIFFVLIGISLLTYALSIITAFIIEGELKDIIWRKKMDKKISELKNHIILCGYGTTGKYIAQELYETNNPFVVIEKDENILLHIKSNQNSLGQNLLYLMGDATTDEILIKAGIREAKGLISVLAEDRDNLFVVLTAKGLNEKLKIVSKCNERDSEQKLIKAGADFVVITDYIGGMRMVSVIIRPAVVNFLDLMLKEKDKTLRVEEIKIQEDSKYVNKKIKELETEKFKEAILVAITDKDKYVFNPDKNTVINPGNCLIFWGNVQEINEIRKIV